MAALVSQAGYILFALQPAPACQAIKQFLNPDSFNALL